MAFQNIRPVHILSQEGIGKEKLLGVFSGIARALSLAGVFKVINMQYLGQRRHHNYRQPDGVLMPNKSLDWHIELARKNSQREGFLNSTVLLDSLKENWTSEANLRYELAVINEPLHYHSNAIRSVNGVGREGHGTVISLHPYRLLLQPDFLLRTQMLTMHELGHVFGLFTEVGSQDPTDEEMKKMHCQNNCAMHIYREIDQEREIRNRPFCPSCLEN